ncbi:ferritin-like domain-containing protein [Rhizobium sp. YIM 134829]|uniref:ferritin-like domain-containing protein n=1 Tax=Rhizobium sp. YIM 134829 TaxID=3390453 RepID=UPI0039792A31
MTFLKQGEEAQIDLNTLDLQAGRRAFLRTAGVMAAGAAAIGVTGLPGEAAAQEINDAAILNFALNLEYLEAEFYFIAAFGRRLDDGDVTGSGRPGGVIGGKKVDFKTRLILEYAQEIARDERSHVQFLRKALGSAKVARPAINLRSSFTAAARAAGLVDNKTEFDAFANEDNFLLAAFIFEDVGVTAYKGAARFIENKDYLEAAAGILAVEAYHAGAIRGALASRGLFKQAQAISNARDSLDGASDLDQGIGTASDGNIVPTDANGIAFSRTPQQVLNIVYLGEQASEASFFPRKLNGAIA